MFLNTFTLVPSDQKSSFNCVKHPFVFLSHLFPVFWLPHQLAHPCCLNQAVKRCTWTHRKHYFAFLSWRIVQSTQHVLQPATETRWGRKKSSLQQPWSDGDMNKMSQLLYERYESSRTIENTLTLMFPTIKKESLTLRLWNNYSFSVPHQQQPYIWYSGIHLFMILFISFQHYSCIRRRTQRHRLKRSASFHHNFGADLAPAEKKTLYKCFRGSFFNCEPGGEKRPRNRSISLDW